MTPDWLPTNACLDVPDSTRPGTPAPEGSLCLTCAAVISQYEIYSKIFHDILEEDKYKFLDVGIEKGDIGTHSFQKGLATMVVYT